MADDDALVRGIVVLLKACLDLPHTVKDAELSSDATNLLARIKAGESEMALLPLVAAIQVRVGDDPIDSACRQAVEQARKLVRENSN
jgi:hypothetical protein